MATSPGSNRSANMSSQPVSPASFGRGAHLGQAGLDPGSVGIGNMPLGILPGPSRLRSGVPQVQAKPQPLSGSLSKSWKFQKCYHEAFLLFHRRTYLTSGFNTSGPWLCLKTTP